MSAITQELIYGVTGQQLIFDAPEGRAASVTSCSIFEIGDGDDDTVQTAPGTAAVETNPATTFSSASGYSQSDRTLCTLTSGTGISVGRTYLATNTFGEKEWITVKALSGGSIYAAAPLKNDFAATSTFQGTRIAATINATWIATENRISDALALTPGYRVRWKYVVGTTTYVHDSYFDVVRYAWVHSVTQADMRSYVVDWDDRLPTDHREDGGARIIDRAAQTVKLDLKRCGIDAALVRHSETRDELVMAAAAVALERAGSDARLVALDNYNRLMDGLLRIARRVPIATDDSGAGGQTVPVGIWGK